MADSQQMFKAGHAQGQAQEKTSEWVESAKDAAGACQDKASAGAQATRENAQQSKEATAGFLQQTGEQMMNMAQGAVDTVKNTLGVGDQRK